MAANTNAQRRRDNLQRWIDAQKLSRSDLATRLGVTKCYATLLFDPRRFFGEKAARSIEVKLRLPGGYLDQEVHGPGAASVWGQPEELPEGVYGMVPRVLLSMGHGGRLRHEEQSLPPLALRRDWLLRNQVSSRGNLRLLEMPDDGMADWLRAGDLVLVDLGQDRLREGAVYAIKYGSELRVRRLGRRFDGCLVIRSNSPKYPDEVLTAQDAAQITILGLVLWRAG